MDGDEIPDGVTPPTLDVAKSAIATAAPLVHSRGPDLLLRSRGNNGGGINSRSTIEGQACCFRVGGSSRRDRRDVGRMTVPVEIGKLMFATPFFCRNQFRRIEETCDHFFFAPPGLVCIIVE
jgi:hypothetical protein